MADKYNYIIGDIHGCYEELLELEQKIIEHSEQENVLPFIISCGDLLDRGPYSKEVLEHFIKGEKAKTHTAILGNHEVMLLQIFEYWFPEKLTCEFPKLLETFNEIYKLTKYYFPETSYQEFIQTMNKKWLDEGGKETLESFNININDLQSWEKNNGILDYLLNLAIYYEGNNFFITHGLATSGDLQKIKSYSINTAEQELIDIKSAVNTVIWNRKVPEEKISDKLHISGHSPLKDVRKIEAANAIQIDTACVYGNKLTAYCAETNTYLTIDAKKAYRAKTTKV